MRMSTTQKILALAVYSLVLASFVYFLSPTKTLTVTKIEVKEVIKEVEASKTHTKTVMNTHKDGTSTTIIIADNDTNTTIDTNKDTKTEITKEVTRSSNGISIGLLRGINVSDLSSKYFYAAQVSLPITILPVSIVLQAATNKTVMLGLTLKLP